MSKKKKSDVIDSESMEKTEKFSDFKQSLKSLGKKTWYEDHLPWADRVVRKPKIKFELPRIPKIKTPSKFVYFIVFLVAFGFIIAGILYDLTRNTIPLNYKQEDQLKQVIPVFFWRDLHEQFAIEGVVAAIVIIMGAFGVLFIYQSTKNFYRPKTAYSYIVIGIAMIILSFILVEYFISQKGVNMYSASA